MIRNITGDSDVSTPQTLDTSEFCYLQNYSDDLGVVRCNIDGLRLLEHNVYGFYTKVTQVLRVCSN